MGDSTLSRIRDLHQTALEKDPDLISLNYAPEHAPALGKLILETFPVGLPETVYFYCKNVPDSRDSFTREHMEQYFNEFMDRMKGIIDAGSLHHLFTILGGKVNPAYIMKLIDTLPDSPKMQDINDILIALPANDLILKNTVFNTIKKKTGIGKTDLTTHYKRLLRDIEDVEDPIETVTKKIMELKAVFKYAVFGDDKGFFIRRTNGCLYKPGVKNELEMIVDGELEKIDPKLSRGTRRNEIMEKIRIKTGIDFQWHEPDRDIIIFKNGVYHLDTWTFKPFTGNEDGVSFTWIPHEYNPLAPEVDIFDDFLQEVLVTDEQVQCWWEWMGYCLTRWIGYKKASLFHGPINSGKSTLSKIMQNVIGAQNRATTQFKRICEDRFANSTLIGKIWNYDDDIGKKPIEETDNFKKLLGYETMNVEEKHQTSYDSYNMIKIQTCANNIPWIPELDVIAPKLVVLRFPNQYPEVEGFVRQFLTDEIAQYIITRSLYELRDRNRRGFFTGMTAEQSLDYLRKETNPVYGFLNDCCLLDEPNPQCTSQEEVYQAFTEWADLLGRDIKFIKDKGGFTRKIYALGFVSARPTKGGERVRVYSGIRLKDNWSELDVKDRFDVDDIQLTQNSIVKRKKDRGNAIESRNVMADVINNHVDDDIKDAIMMIEDVENLTDREIMDKLRIVASAGDKYRIIAELRENGDI
jgi:P4 family phage/plasmid primase-like protien